MDRRLGILFVALGLGLAGCSEEPTVHGQGAAAGTTPGSTQTSQEPIDVKTSSQRGGILGVVVDPAIRPLAGANVTLVGQDRNATTNANGEFGFDLLEPGTYFLQAHAAHFLVSQSSVQVEPGKTQSVRILLESDGVPLPSHPTEKKTGFAEMDLGVLGADSLPLQCQCAWTVYPEAGFRTFVVEGQGTTQTPRPPNPNNAGTLKQIWWTLHDKPWTHGIGYNYTDFPFTAHLSGAMFLNSTSELVLQVDGGGWPNGQMQFDIFLTTFYIEPAPPGWSFLKGDP
jgi:hypothetical protein